jgi:protein SCO1/2
VDESIFSGKVTALFFGYTHCPDVCPTTLGEAANWKTKLGSSAENLQVIFVTVDPARDTVELLAEYMPYFDETFIGLTGTQDQIDKVTKGLGVYAAKSDVQDEDAYLMDHTASVYLVDDSGFFSGTISFNEDTDTAIGKIQRLLDRAG